MQDKTEDPLLPERTSRVVKFIRSVVRGEKSRINRGKCNGRFTGNLMLRLAIMSHGVIYTDSLQGAVELIDYKM